MLTGRTDRESVLERVRAELASVRAGRHRDPIAIHEETRLADLDISSLDLAEVISNLESAFEVDPFAETVPITSITDVRSLCDAYMRCLSPAPDGRDELDDELRAIRNRSRDAREP